MYPYLLVRAGSHLNGDKPLLPENIEMIYWFADYPGQPERFPYNPEQYQADEEYLLGQVETIERLDEADFPLTDDIRTCRYCVYRSLCDRGVEAGSFKEQEDTALEESAEPLDFEIDFDQIAEVEF